VFGVGIHNLHQFSDHFNSSIYSLSHYILLYTHFSYITIVILLLHNFIPNIYIVGKIIMVKQEKDVHVSKMIIFTPIFTPNSIPLTP